MATGPKLVIFDLDGTLLDSERVVQRVVKGLVERRGCAYTDAVAKAGLGMRPEEATAALIEAAGGLGGASAEEVHHFCVQLVEGVESSCVRSLLLEGLRPGHGVALPLCHPCIISCY